MQYTALCRWREAGGGEEMGPAHPVHAAAIGAETPDVVPGEERDGAEDPWRYQLKDKPHSKQKDNISDTLTALS